MLSNAVAYIQAFKYKGSQPGLTRIEKLLIKLGLPQDELRFIHVAGTNGKGSVCAMLASILTKSGYKTGLFTSPYIFSYHEQFVVNGEPIKDSKLEELVSEVMPLVESMEEKPTEFELITALAIYYFKQEECDFVIFETGLGGKQDATNVIPPALVTVLTSIGLDHTEFLGNTLEKITLEKAGIIKEGTHVVLCKQEGEVEKIVRKICREKHATLALADGQNGEICVRGSLFQTVSYKGYSCLLLNLLGEYQYTNAVVVLETIISLNHLGILVKKDAVIDGLKSVRWRGRFELLKSDPTIILDAAHNPNGVAELLKNLKVYFPKQKITFVMGVMGDKDYGKMIEIIAPIAEAFIVVSPQKNERALSTVELSEAIRHRFHGEIIEVNNINKIANECNKPTYSKRVICIFGTLYMMNEIYDAF